VKSIVLTAFTYVEELSLAMKTFLINKVKIGRLEMFSYRFHQDLWETSWLPPL